jgi:hypothetical protein
MGLDQRLKEKEQERQKNRTIWKPEKEGEVLTGKVVQIGKTITPFGESAYCEISTQDGQVWTVFLNVVLEDRFKEEGVGKGDTIAIKYLGTKRSKKGKKTYRDFIVAKDSTDARTDAQSETLEDKDDEPF